MIRPEDTVRMDRYDMVCPMCRGRDWRVRVKTRDFLCKKCGTVFGTIAVDDDYIDVYPKTPQIV